MNKHKHEGEITFDKQLRCRLCEAKLDSFEEIISTEVSGKRATRIIKEIAEAGEYKVVDGSPDFPTYSKDIDELITEITVRKIGEREYEVIKRIHYKDVVGIKNGL